MFHNATCTSEWTGISERPLLALTIYTMCQAMLQWLITSRLEWYTLSAIGQYKMVYVACKLAHTAVCILISWKMNIRVNIYLKSIRNQTAINWLMYFRRSVNIDIPVDSFAKFPGIWFYEFISSSSLVKVVLYADQGTSHYVKAIQVANHKLNESASI